MAAWLSREHASESADGKTVRPSLAMVGPVGGLLLGGAAGKALLTVLLSALLDDEPPDEHADAAANITSTTKPAAILLPENIGTHPHDQPIAGNRCTQVTHDVTFAQ